MRFRLIWIGGLAVALLSTADGRPQTGAPPQDGGSPDGRGSYSRFGSTDRNERFNQYTGGRDYWSRADIQDSDQLQRFDRMAQQLGITNGVISRQQSLDYYQQMGDRFGGTRSGGPPPMMSAPDGTSTLAPTAPGSSDGRGRPAWGTPEAAESMFRRLDK